MKWLLIAGGGALGSVLRYALQVAAQRLTGGNFPVGTLAVNLIGCFLIGLLVGMANGPIPPMREEYRIGLMVGVLGGFTTFSSFGLETFLLASNGQWWQGALNVAASCVLGLAAVWCGYRLAEAWFAVA